MAKENVSVRKKVVCSIVIAIAALLMIFAFCGRFFNSGLKSVANFFVGSFGMAFYGLMIATIVFCSFMLAGKNIRVPAKYITHFCLIFLEIVLLVHMYTTVYISSEPFAQYASLVYNYYSGVPTFGGIVFGSLVYGFERAITIYGASVVLFGLLAWSVYVAGDFFYSYFTGKLSLTKKRVKEDIKPVAEPSVAEPVPEVEDERARAYDILFNHGERSLNTEEVTRTGNFETAPQSTLDRQVPHTREEVEDFLFRHNSTYMGGAQPVEVDEPDTQEFGVKGYYNAQEQPAPAEKPAEPDTSWRISRPTEPQPAREPEPQPAPQKPAAKDDFDEPVDAGWVTVNTTPRRAPERVDVVDVVAPEQPEAPVAEQPKPAAQPAPAPQPQPVVSEPQSLEFQFEDDDSFEDEQPFAETYEEAAEEPAPIPESQPEPEPEPEDENEIVAIEKEIAVPGGVQVGFDFRTKEEIRQAQEKIHKYPKYNTPPADLLNDAVISVDDDAEFRAKAAQAIVNKLAVFGIKVESVDQVVGPTVTRYLFSVLSQKTRMGDFKQYSADLKACLEAQDEIRIEAPVEGTNLVGIEVANKVRRTVMLRSMLESKAFKEKKGALVFTIGQEISGSMIVADLAKLPHLLVAGTTGSGKSVFLNSMIVSLMYRYGPEYLRFVMVDPKFVELSRYNGIPHMLTTEAITTQNDALAAMDYLIAEMESRYQLFRQSGVANIIDYNGKVNPKLAQRLPYLVLVVDELADLMSVCQKNFEAKLQRLAQKSRAAGIHIVLATQRPDVKTITGTIKTNLPCRIAFKVSSPQDSITILNGGGAEKLLGKGDMLYMDPAKAGLTRAQCPLISDEEIAALVQYTASQNEVFYDASISESIFVSRKQEEPEPQQAEPAAGGGGGAEQLDPYCKKALRFWIERQNGRASIASIQRALKIGFNRAGRIMDMLQRLGYVEQLAPSDTSTKPVKVLVSVEELDSLFPDMEDY